MNKQFITATHPDIAKQIHPAKNININSDIILPGSHKKIWWLCPKTCKYGCIHEYEQGIRERITSKDCLFCSGILICKHKSLAYLYPDIAKQLHPTKNTTLDSTTTKPGSHQLVWWLCPKKCEYGCLHEYQQTVKEKVYGQGCPFCRESPKQICLHQSLEFLHPGVAKLWHTKKNGELKPSYFTPHSRQMIWWKCLTNCEHGCSHDYKQTIQSKMNDRGCPYCTDNSVKFCYHKTLEFNHPKIAKEWHPSKNGDLKPSQVTSHSGKKYWWTCSKKCDYGCLHDYEYDCRNRVSGYGCPYCSQTSTKLCYHQSLEFNYPEIAKEWHPNKNDFKPSEIKQMTDKKVWWICPNNPNHDYEQSISSRTGQNQGCPYCKNKTETKIIRLANKNIS